MASKPDKSATPAASAPSVSKTIGTKPIRTISNGSLKGECVGPKDAPIYQK